MWEWVCKRGKERSTWSALIALASIAGYSCNPELQEQIITAGTAVIAVIYAITSDSKAIAKGVSDGLTTVDSRQTISTPDLTEEQKSELNRS